MFENLRRDHEIESVGAEPAYQVSAVADDIDPWTHLDVDAEIPTRAEIR